MALLDIALWISFALMMAPTGLAVVKGPVEMVGALVPGIPSADLATPFADHVLHIDMGKNIFLTCLLAWTALKANLETKKAVSLLMIAQMCFACFVAHGLHSPLHMSKQYVERLTSEPAVMVICMGQAVALGLGVLTAGAAAKKSKKK